MHLLSPAYFWPCRCSGCGATRTSSASRRTTCCARRAEERYGCGVELECGAGETAAAVCCVRYKRWSRNRLLCRLQHPVGCWLQGAAADVELRGAGTQVAAVASCCHAAAPGVILESSCSIWWRPWWCCWLLRLLYAGAALHGTLCRSIHTARHDWWLVQCWSSPSHDMELYMQCVAAWLSVGLAIVGVVTTR